MTEEQLEEIISLGSEEKIDEKFKELGFRLANKSFRTEFDYVKIKNKSKPAVKVRKENISTRYVFTLTMFDEVEGYEGNTFVLVNVAQKKGTNDYATFDTLLLYTDMPINEEYERDMNTQVKCVKCQGEFLKRQLLYRKGVYVCPKCSLFNIEYLLK